MCSLAPPMKNHRTNVLSQLISRGVIYGGLARMTTVVRMVTQAIQTLLQTATPSAKRRTVSLHAPHRDSHHSCSSSGLFAFVSYTNVTRIMTATVLAIATMTIHQSSRQSQSQHRFQNLRTLNVSFSDVNAGGWDWGTGLAALKMSFRPFRSPFHVVSSAVTRASSSVVIPARGLRVS